MKYFKRIAKAWLIFGCCNWARISFFNIPNDIYYLISLKYHTDVQGYMSLILNVLIVIFSLYGLKKLLENEL